MSIGHQSLRVAMSFRKPRPRPPTTPPARDTLSAEKRAELAVKADYVGSPHHTDVPKFGLQIRPRPGAMPIERAEEEGFDNPACTICPRKWARRPHDVTSLLRKAIEDGNFVASPDGGLPRLIWARDPDDPDLVYEAKLCQPPAGYKGYPLTRFQSEYNLPIEVL